MAGLVHLKLGHAMKAKELIDLLLHHKMFGDVVIEVVHEGNQVGDRDNWILMPIDVEAHSELGAVIIAPVSTRKMLSDETNG